MKLFNNFSFRKLLYNKKIAISLSILVAFIFWLTIVVDQNDEREQTFSNLPIEVSTEGTVWGEQGLQVVNEITQNASVTVFGPNYIVSSLKTEDFKISADISSINGAGTYSINLSAVRNSNVSGYSFLSVTPSAVTVQFDYIDQKDFIITPKVEGFQKVEGLSYDDAVVANAGEETLSVKGPRNEISKISSVIAYAYTEKTLNSTTIFDGEIKFLDADGKEVNVKSLQLEAESVKISVPVSKTKTFKFSPSYINSPNKNVTDYLNSIFVSDVDKFTVAGPPEVIDSLNALEFTPIDVTKINAATSKQSFQVKPVLPSSVRITDGIEVATVTFDVKGLSTKKVKINNFNYANTLPTGLTASFSGEVSVEVCGKKSLLNSLSEDEYYFSVDLSDATKGESLVKAIVKTKSDAVVWQTTSCEIKVVIK